MQGQAVVWEPHHLEIQARWRPLVQAAGLDSHLHQPDHTYLLATAIMKDTIVQRGADPLAVVQGMTDGEKQALCTRIIKKHRAKVVSFD
jgi:hypothetical protein